MYLNGKNWITRLTFGLIVLLLLAAECGGDDSDSFTLSLGSTSISIEQGKSGDITVNITRSGNFSESIAISLDAPPTGISATPLTIPESDTSGKLTINVDPNVKADDYTLTIKGDAAPKSATAELKLTVTAGNGGGTFTLSLGSTSTSIEQGKSDDITVNVTRSGNFSESIAISLDTPPAGISADSLTISESDTSGQLTINVAPNVKADDYTLTIKGDAAPKSATAELKLTVTAAPEQEVRDAVKKALPKLENFELVKVDDKAAIATLRDLAAKGPSDTPTSIGKLPVIGAAGEISQVEFIAYPHNVYADPEKPAGKFEINVVRYDIQDNEPNDEVIQVINTPSLTFQGMPSFNAFDNYLEFGEAVENGKVKLDDESKYQASVVNVIEGAGLEATYYGLEPEGANTKQSASVLESLQGVLELSNGEAEVKRLMELTENNYVLYNHSNFQPEVLHGEVEAPPVVRQEEINTQEHFLENGWRTFNAVMVGDDTIYNPDTGSFLVSNWFSRTAAAANRANFYWVWAQWGPNIPSTATSLPSGVRNNGLVVRTRLREYRVLTKFGKSLITKPSNSCGGSGSFVDVVRKLSLNFERFHNEAWMWWTRSYGGGCAYISTVHRAPGDYAVGWSGYGNATTDWVSFVFMHEFGHIIGGTHSTNAPGSPETFNSHRCRLLGFWSFGPTGPSLMSYANGTRTYCFATTPSSGTPKKNATKVAEFLHTRLDP